MLAVRIAPALSRPAWAAVFALVLALRLLTPAGFMPAFDQGAVTIVACPDGGAVPVHHRHGEKTAAHQPCPYADASSIGGLVPDLPLISLLFLFAIALTAGGAAQSIAGNRTRQRPPATGPPLQA